MKNLINTAKRNTDNNLHTENYLLLSEHFKLNNLSTIFESILKIQKVENCLPYKLGEYRFEKYLSMLQEIKAKVTPQEYEQIYNSL